MTWTEKSQTVIRECVLVWIDATGKARLQGMSPEDKRELIRIIRTHYPFGERDSYPYKAWLKAVKTFEKWLYLPETQAVNNAAACREGLFA